MFHLSYSYTVLLVLGLITAVSAQPPTAIPLHKKVQEMLKTDPAEALELAEEEIREARSQKDIGALAYGYLDEGNALWLLGRYSRAKESYLEALDHFEELEDFRGMVITYNDMSLIDLEGGDEAGSHAHLRMASMLNSGLKDSTLETVIRLNMGTSFIESGQLDSAEYYVKKSKEALPGSREKAYEYGILNNLGRIYSMTGRVSEAQELFNRAAYKALASGDKRYLSEILLNISRHHLSAGDTNASVSSVRRAMVLDQELNSAKRILDGVGILYEIYDEQGHLDSAYHYAKKKMSLQNEIMNADEIRRLDDLGYEEKRWKQEILEEKREEEEKRRHLMQYLTIIIIIISLFSVVLIINERNIHFRHVEVMVSIAVLLFFEFISLVLHPLLGSITHHSPILMLIALVITASFLAPAHHHSMRYWKDQLLKRRSRRGQQAPESDV